MTIFHLFIHSYLHPSKNVTAKLLLLCNKWPQNTATLKDHFIMHIDSEIQQFEQSTAYSLVSTPRYLMPQLRKVKPPPRGDSTSRSWKHPKASNTHVCALVRMTQWPELPNWVCAPGLSMLPGSLMVCWLHSGQTFTALKFWQTT